MSVRLSPAASLLRNSRLFALPPAISLPAAEPSSEPVPFSDTATTIHPTRAAIETPLSSLHRGDWGLKRPLPLKSTTKTGTPTVRLARGIDTPEHVADFESAADHVLTLKKFQDLKQSIRVPPEQSSRDFRQFSVFRPEFDNTTNSASTSSKRVKTPGIWPNLSNEEIQRQIPSRVRRTQPEMADGVTQESGTVGSAQSGLAAETAGSLLGQKRWRFDGPSLICMSDMEFDTFLKSLDGERKAAFRQLLKKEIIREEKEKARNEGNVESHATYEASISDERITEYLRKLRSEPQKFGPLLAEFLDLPEAVHVQHGNRAVWEYGRSTLATDYYQDQGPPRTHPSAGLSYIQNASFTENHPEYGPQAEKSATIARAVKTRTRGIQYQTSYGVAGFVISARSSRALKSSYGNEQNKGFVPMPGGQKIPVKPTQAFITSDGSVNLSVDSARNFAIQDDKAVPKIEIRRQEEEQMTQQMGQDRVMQPLSRTKSRTTQYKKQQRVEPDEDVDAVLHQMANSFGRGGTNIAAGPSQVSPNKL